MDFDEAGAVYAIFNPRAGKVYVGATADFPSERFKRHRVQLQQGRHPNARLQADWCKDGPEAFRLQILEYAHPAHLRKREQFWLDAFDAAGTTLYNRRTTDGRCHSGFVLKGSWLVPYWTEHGPPGAAQEHTEPTGIDKGIA